MSRAQCDCAGRSIHRWDCSWVQSLGQTQGRRIYISGPMSGVPESNFPAFFAAEAYWASLGWQPVNPAHNFGGRVDLSRQIYMRADYVNLMDCNAIALLPGWQGSKGSLSELNMANELDMEVFDAATGLPLEATVRMIAEVAEHRVPSVDDVVYCGTSRAQYEEQR